MISCSRTVVATLLTAFFLTGLTTMMWLLIRFVNTSSMAVAAITGLALVAVCSMVWLGTVVLLMASVQEAQSKSAKATSGASVTPTTGSTDSTATS